jgi:TRAP-type C4-dicarboxylate transport system substrate-binding protein
MNSISKLAAVALFALTTTAARADEPIQLKFANAVPPPALINVQGLYPWVEEVNKAAAGAFEVKTFPGPGLANLANAYDRTINGVTEIAWGIFGPISSQFPKTSVYSLPFEAKSGTEAAVGLWRLYANGTVSEEFAKVHLLGIGPFPGIYLHTKKPIRTMADMQGVKFGLDGRVISRTIESLGGTPVAIPISDFYASLQRGTIDGSAGAWSGVVTFKLFEVTNHHLEVALGNDAGYVVMNKEAYERLPQNARAGLDKLSGEALTRRLTQAVDNSNIFARDKVKSEPGQTVAQLAPDEEARWVAKVAPVIDEWTKSVPDGAKVLAAFRREVRKLRAN